MPLVVNMYSGKSNEPGVFRVLEAPRLHISYVGSTIAFAYHQNVLKRSKVTEEEERKKSIEEKKNESDCKMKVEVIGLGTADDNSTLCYHHDVLFDIMDYVCGYGMMGPLYPEIPKLCEHLIQV